MNTMQRNQRMNHRREAMSRGFMMIDTIVAMGLIGVIATTLLLAKSGIKRLDEAMADRRAATRVAERYLLEQNRTQAAAPANAGIHVSDLATAAPAGWKWVNVDAAVNGQHSELTGLIRAGLVRSGS